MVKTVEEKIINHGVLEGRRDTDYVADEKVGALPYEIRNSTGDWRNYLPVGERQYSNPGSQDSMSCVSFSALNSIEVQEKFLTGVEKNYSDRWIAKMSNTTVDGNYLYTVADTIRKLGAVPEAAYPAPPTPWTFAQYHQSIPEPLLSQLKAKGQDWLAAWEISYEWVEVTKDSFLKHLKHAPLQLVIPGHAIVGILCEADVVRYFDSYEHGSATNYTGQTALSTITSALKIVLTPKTMEKFKVNKSGKLGIMIDYGFDAVIKFAKDGDMYAHLLADYEVPADAPTVNL